MVTNHKLSTTAMEEMHRKDAILKAFNEEPADLTFSKMTQNCYKSSLFFSSKQTANVKSYLATLASINNFTLRLFCTKATQTHAQHNLLLHVRSEVSEDLH